MLLVAWSSEKMPTADSYISVTRIMNWAIAGKDRSLAGSGGMPIEIDERDTKTVD